MKKSLKLFAALGLMIGMVACGKDEKPSDGPENPTEPTELKADFTFEVKGLDVVFTNTSTGATSYKWDFGDEETSKEASPTHSYASSGEYVVRLMAANADGIVDKKEQTVKVLGAPKAYFSFETLPGRAGKFGKVIAFDASSSQNAESVNWDFGDGKTGTGFKVEHEFAEFKKYTIKATVKGADGSEDSFSADIETVFNDELLRGSEMNEGDEKYWTVLPLVGTKLDESLEAGWAPDFEHMAWTPTFGYTADKPKGGKGACLRLSPEYQLHAYSNNFCMYQEIDVEKDDVLRVSAEMKWGENNNDNGVLFIGFVKEAPKANADQNGIEGITDPDAIIQVYNYWNANNGSIPAFDGNFASAKEVLGGFGCTGDGKEYVEYKVTETGKLYFFFDYRNIWGATWGPRRDILLDNFSIKKVN